MRAALSMRRCLAVLLILLLAGPFPAFGAGSSLGTAQGVRGVELSLDGGQRWLPLGARSLPILDGVQVRTSTGGAMLDLADGSRVNVLPFTSVRFRETGATTEISLVYGRLTFRLPRDTRVEVRTATAQLTPVRKDPMAGEVFLSGDGTVGLRMTEGTLQVNELTGGKRSLLASVEPVFLPQRPAGKGPLFTTDVQSTPPPAAAKGVFNPKGESLGYLTTGGRLVISPGFTADLTRPFSPKLIQLAIAQVPESSRSDALPLFDVNGGYVGYLAGPVYHAQAVGVPPQQPPPSDDDKSDNTALYILGGAAIVVGGTLGGLAASGQFSGGGGGGGNVSTPLRPRR